jgi:hypothetical protein
MQRRSSLKVSDVFWPILTEFGISRQLFVRIPGVKFLGIPASSNRPDTWGQTNGRTAMTKLIAPFVSMWTHQKRKKEKKPGMLITSSWRLVNRKGFGLKCLWPVSSYRRENRLIRAKGNLNKCHLLVTASNALPPQPNTV